MKIRRPRRLVKGLGLALAAAAFAAPSAQAVLQGDQSGTIDSIQPTIYTDNYRAGLPRPPVSNQVVLYSDNYRASVPRSQVSSELTLYSDNFRTALSRPPVSSELTLYSDNFHGNQPVSDEPRGYAPINTRVVPVSPPLISEAASGSSGFDWADAGIGAVIALILMGFGAAILAARQIRRSRLAAV